jgi:hypothetical protein
MNRRAILIAACTFAAVSLGLNAWLLVRRNQEPFNAGGSALPPTSELPPDVSAGPVLQPVTMDFIGTAFADGSWKLTDEPDPIVSIDDKPFSWDDVKSETGKVEIPGRPPFEPLKSGGPFDLINSPKPVESLPYDVAEPSPAGSWSPPWKARGVPFHVREVPGYLGQPLPDPDNVSGKTLLATPPPRR